MKGKIILWTVKDKNQYDLLLKNKELKGCLNSATSFWEDEAWMKSYSWLNDQMRKKIKNYNASTPLWAWTKRPDFRSYRKEIKEGESLFLIKFAKNLDEVLISDFDLWHDVLNGFPSLSKKEDKELEKKYGSDYLFSYWRDQMTSKGKKSKIPKVMKNFILKSWQKIFQVSNKNMNQATFEKLTLDEVLQVKEYKK